MLALQFPHGTIIAYPDMMEKYEIGTPLSINEHGCLQKQTDFINSYTVCRVTEVNIK